MTPSEVDREIDQLYFWFSSEVMRAKMKANSHKGGWRGEMSLKQWISRLEEEITELKLTDPNKPGKIVLECADIANIASMIADCARHKEFSDA